MNKMTPPCPGQFDDAPEYESISSTCLASSLKVAQHSSEVHTSTKPITVLLKNQLGSKRYVSEELAIAVNNRKKDSNHMDQIGDSMVVTMVNGNDVLSGRGKGPNSHGGNVYFRKLIKEYRVSYLATQNRNLKSRICEKIIGTITNLQPPGRFLKKIIVNCEAVWHNIPHAKSMKKTAQALREGIKKNMVE